MSNIVNLDLQNFQHILLEQSTDKLIVIDFWADWCEPCKQLMPVLEKIAAEYADDMILAKVNCDVEQQIAMQFGVRSLPTVIMVKNGQPVDGFAGLQPESAIREVLAKHLPNPIDKALQQAERLLAQQQWVDAANLALQTLEVAPSVAEFKFIAVEALLALKRLDDAEKILATVGMADQQDRYKSLAAKLQLARDAQHSPEVQALKAQWQAQPDNLELVAKLAAVMNDNGEAEAALDMLFSYLQKDLNAGDLKKVYLDIIAALPAGQAVASKARRRLYALLY